MFSYPFLLTPQRLLWADRSLNMETGKWFIEKQKKSESGGLKIKILLQNKNAQTTFISKSV